MVMMSKAKARWFAALVLASWIGSAAAQSTDKGTASSQRLQQLMQPKPLQVTPERLAERERLLVSGEAALARLQVRTAQDAFDRAALILHAADTEIALVRSYMQGGEYRRALAFGAHTAGAHLDVASGSALYAWLLHAGGQGAVAQRLLTEAQVRMPDNAVVRQVQLQLKSGAPIADGQLLSVPLRLAPYSSAARLPASAQVASSGVLLPSGRYALVPLAIVPRSAKLWVRNGLGQISGATVAETFTAQGVALLRLASALPVPDGWQLARREAFAGSVGYVLEYPARPASAAVKVNAAPAWPALHSGFLGAGTPESPNGEQRLLGIDMPAGPRGGVVFDAFGQLAGVALAASAGSADRWVPMSQLQARLPLQAGGKRAAAPALAKTSAVLAPQSPLPKTAADAVYEMGLKTSLQFIVAPK